VRRKEVKAIPLQLAEVGVSSPAKMNSKSKYSDKVSIVPAQQLSASNFPTLLLM